MKLITAILTLALFSFTLFPSRLMADGASPARQLLYQASEALRGQDVGRMATLLENAAKAEGSDEDHTNVAVAHANYFWRIQRDSVKAREILAAAKTLKAKPARPLLELARLDLFEYNFSAAEDEARSAIAAAADKLETHRAKISFASAVVEQILHAELDGRDPAMTPSAAKSSVTPDKLIGEAFEMMDGIVREEPGLRAPSRLAILLALLSGNGAAGLRAWQSYYHVPAGVDAPAPLTESGRVLARTLPSFTSKANSEARRQVVESLAASRLFPEAALLVLRWNLNQTGRIKDVILYARWTREFTRTVNEQYRLNAIGEGEKIGVYKQLQSQGEALWNGLQWPSVKPTFTTDALTTELSSRFGALIRVTPGALNFGHRVREDDHKVEQYGRSAQLRYVVLDSIVSNGYTTWLWDGLAGIGGWAYPASATQTATIIEIRGDGPIGAWIAVTDPAAIEENRKTVERLTLEDDSRAKANPYAFMPGLSRRMAQHGREKILERLKAKGLADAELRSAFLSEIEQVSLASTIFAHEGRHAIDLTEKPNGYSSEELEFRAKLSEVAFAPEPLLALGAIFDSSIGRKGDAHGMANERIMKGLVAWMEAHAAEIKTLDKSRPLLPQFDKLTDDQMRAAFRSMDPWANPTVSSAQH